MSMSMTAPKSTRKLVVSSDGKKVLGAVLVGDVESYGDLLQLKLNDMELPDKPEVLILPAMEGSPRKAFGPDALPMSAVICSCNNVTKGDICSAIDGGVKDLPGLKAATKLATSCGGCSALAGSVLKCELEKRGVEVKKDLCEHFAFSRQELFHLIKVEGIRSFDDLIHKHGKGDGLRYLQADRRLHLRLAVERTHPEEAAGRSAGHQ
jgi:nitrite reductase (NADH) large subunit